MEKFIACVIMLVAFIFIYFILYKLFTTMFMVTGLSREKASFQTITLITGIGFTTAETELILYNMTRRKIAKAAQIISTLFNVCIVAVTFGVITNIDYNADDSGKYFLRICIVLLCSFLGLIICILLTKIPALKKVCYNAIEKVLTRKQQTKTGNKIEYYDNIYDKVIAIVELKKIPKSMQDKKIKDINFKALDLVIMSVVNENKQYIKTDVNDTVLKTGDTIRIYGYPDIIEKVFSLK